MCTCCELWIQCTQNYLYKRYTCRFWYRNIWIVKPLRHDPFIFTLKRHNYKKKYSWHYVNTICGLLYFKVIDQGSDIIGFPVVVLWLFWFCFCFCFLDFFARWRQFSIYKSIGVLTLSFPWSSTQGYNR